MSGPCPWGAPAGPSGNLACGLQGFGERGCWRSVGRAAGSAERCPALAECVDIHLAAFGYGRRPESVRPLRAGAGNPAEPCDAYVVDVLRADASLVASFACPLEAVR